MSDYYCGGVVGSHLTTEAETKWKTNSYVNVVARVHDLLMLVGLSAQLPNQVVQGEGAAMTSSKYMYDVKMMKRSMKTEKKNYS